MGLTRSRSQVTSFYWWCAAAAGLGLFLALLARDGTHGLYSDDYTFKCAALDLATGEWKPRLIVDPYFRPLAQSVTANLAVAIPEREVPVRVLWALVHCTNALLVGLFTYRLLPSPLAAVFSVLLFLVPVPAQEALLWHAAVSGAGLGALVLLVTLHILLTVVQSRRRWLVLALISGVCLIIGLASYEQVVISFGMIPIFGLVLLWGQEKSQRKPTILRSSLLMMVGLVIAWLYWLLILSNSSMIGARGGLDLSLSNIFADRIPKVLRDVRWHTVDTWGLGGMWKSVALLGIGQIAQAPIELCTLGGLICILIAMAASSTRGVLRDLAPPSVARHLTGLLGIGIVLLVAAFTPAILIRRQGIESRMFYIPWIGFTLALTATLESLVRVLTRRTWWPGRVMILSVGLVYLAGVLTLRGFAHVYHLRSEHDQRQIAALVKAVPSLPLDTKIVVMPIQLNEHSVQFSTGKESLPDKLLYGVFETTWSAASAMQMTYRHPEIKAIASSHWSRLCFTVVHSSPSGTADQIAVNGSLVATNHLLAFTYENDRAVLVNPLILVDPNGTEISIPLLLVDQVRTVTAAVASRRMKLEPLADACR